MDREQLLVLPGTVELRAGAEAGTGTAESSESARIEGHHRLGRDRDRVQGRDRVRAGTGVPEVSFKLSPLAPRSQSSRGFESALSLTPHQASFSLLPL